MPEFDFRKRNILPDDFEEIKYGDKFDVATEIDITYQSRWETYRSQVFKHKETGRFVRIIWSRGSTEYQDTDNATYELEEVKPVEKLVTLYEVIKEN